MSAILGIALLTPSPVDAIPLYTLAASAVDAVSPVVRVAQDTSAEDCECTLAVILNFLTSLLWPATAIVAMILFRAPLVALLGKGGVKLEAGPLKVEIEKQLEASAAEAKATQSAAAPSSARATEERSLSAGPTPSEHARAAAVRSVAQTALTGGDELIWTEAKKLAREYEELRASMQPGDERTRRMEVVMSKMRTIGLAVHPRRYDLMASSSPGERLVAIAALQVRPDYEGETLNWLVDRVAQEKPFVGYHAAVALVQAARGPGAAVEVTALSAAVERSRTQNASLSHDTDRFETLTQFERAVTVLTATPKPPR